MKPDYLSSNARITFVAPSFGCTRSPYKERLEESTRVLQEIGFQIIEGELIHKANAACASDTGKARAKEFMDAYCSDTDAIFSVGGGEMMMEILPYINFEKIKKQKPKWFMGYSDNTNLIYPLTILCDIEGIYGPHAAAFYDISYDAKDALDMLMGKKEFYGYPKWQSKENKNPPLAPYKLDRKKIIKSKNYQPFEGILIGGCLDILKNLCGTQWDKTEEYTKKHEEGVIFFFEACDMNSLDIERALFQLKHAGWFHNVKGFVIGRTRLFQDKSFGITPEKAYIQALKEYHVPILLNVDLGHLSPALPFRHGAYCSISLTEDNNIKMVYKD